jgi:hypothetical protein
VGAVWAGLLLQLVITLVALGCGAARDRALPFGPALVAGWLLTITVVAPI